MVVAPSAALVAAVGGAVSARVVSVRAARVAAGLARFVSVLPVGAALLPEVVFVAFPASARTVLVAFAVFSPDAVIARFPAGAVFTGATSAAAFPGATFTGMASAAAVPADATLAAAVPAGPALAGAALARAALAGAALADTVRADAVLTGAVPAGVALADAALADTVRADPPPVDSALVDSTLARPALAGAAFAAPLPVPVDTAPVDRAAFPARDVPVAAVSAPGFPPGAPVAVLAVLFFRAAGLPGFASVRPRAGPRFGELTDPVVAGPAGFAATPARPRFPGLAAVAVVAMVAAVPARPDTLRPVAAWSPVVTFLAMSARLTMAPPTCKKRAHGGRRALRRFARIRTVSESDNRAHRGEPFSPHLSG
ncbi:MULTISPECIES: hypothetical protein [Catenuloplanes]|uniref:Uncharacterized protein n=1 Tax=Catenuloplanes niger TaxID=587534 RepID=A0AAE4CR13_9ACTN|nr:hypothetical protein [Catenuloplanes niger]MDR7321565.1 hypothetical protein [Catenuloplanes niger]